MDVKKLIQDRDLDIKIIAKELFPENAYPQMAFKRILKGEATLSVPQIKRLAALAGMDPSKALSGNWTKRSKGTKFTITSGDYRAELDMKSWITRLFHGKSMFHEELLTRPFIPLSEYIAQVEDRITKHEFE